MSTEDRHARIVEHLDAIMNDKLSGLLPASLTSVKPEKWGFAFTFKPFTGREPEPKAPGEYWKLPRLAFRYIDEEAGRPLADDAEYRLRRDAIDLLDDVYAGACRVWKDAAYVAELRETVGDAPALWKTYRAELTGLEAAFAHLRTPEAGAEWRAAVSRLLDAQGRVARAAEAFDIPAARIARVREKFFDADLWLTDALARAGYSEGRDWTIPADEYGDGSLSGFLSETADKLIAEQNAHVAEVGRLTGDHV